ncbi:MAG: PH domain-containing protein [Candidatus Hadarchaeales archaeon]
MGEQILPKVFSTLPDEKVLRVLRPERLAFLWLFLGMGVLTAVGVAFLPFFLPVGLFLTAMGVLGFVASFLYSGAFTYYLTSKRILLYRKFITISSRQIQYDDLSDVVVDQGIVGRLFGFGNVIPITKSGLGTEMRGWQMGGGWGGRTTGPIVVGGPIVGEVAPSASPSTCLYGVKEPFEVKDLIFKHQEEYAEAPYLKRIAKAVEEKPGAVKGPKYCPFCGSPLGVEGARFCPSCGKEVRKA